jgi:aconitate hydratase
MNLTIELHPEGRYFLRQSRWVSAEEYEARFSGNAHEIIRENARKGTIAGKILESHNHSGNNESLALKVDATASPDNNYVSILQTAIASGLKEFPIPYVLSNCHNSLCAVGGTINEDDHAFGLSAAKKFGGYYVSPHMGVIHQFMREKFAGCGSIILGSDSHTRYGALGTLGFGEGGGELVKQLLGGTYDISRPDVIAVYLTGAPRPGVGPHDIALSIIRAVYDTGFVKNKILEFIGPGVSALTCEDRIGVDVMATETNCLSTIWCTDDETQKYLLTHGREEAYHKLSPADVTYYDGVIVVPLGEIKPMIALPMHPSFVYSIDELKANLKDILGEAEARIQKTLPSGVTYTLTDKIVSGRLKVQQGIIGGCAGGTFKNIMDAAQIITRYKRIPTEFPFSIYPSSQPIYLELIRNGTIARLMERGVVVRSAICGPCFGAGDTPVNNGLSIRHVTRNFPGREGAKSGWNQWAAVALMDARSIAATALSGGFVTSAEEYVEGRASYTYHFDPSPYLQHNYDGIGKPQPEVSLHYGPNIKDWPKFEGLSPHVLLEAASVLRDPVTTTDELIPSGEASAFRSNPEKLAEFTLKEKDPSYVSRAKAARQVEKMRLETGSVTDPKWHAVMNEVQDITPEADGKNTGLGSFLAAVKPGDGSAREQAASCQRVLGGLANIATEYATKRYRTNLINWGILPFIVDTLPAFEPGDFLFIPFIKKQLEEGKEKVGAYWIHQGKVESLSFALPNLTCEERELLIAGGLITKNRQWIGK